jgi:hypothetical protein
MCEISREGILRMAKTIVEDPFIYMDGDYTPYYYCQYCDAELVGYNLNVTLFEHEPRCPVVHAQGIIDIINKNA